MEEKEKCGKLLTANQLLTFRGSLRVMQIVGREKLVANGCRSAAKPSLFGIISKFFLLLIFGRRDINVIFNLWTYESVFTNEPAAEVFLTSVRTRVLPAFMNLLLSQTFWWLLHVILFISKYWMFVSHLFKSSACRVNDELTHDCALNSCFRGTLTAAGCEPRSSLSGL